MHDSLMIGASFIGSFIGCVAYRLAFHGHKKQQIKRAHPLHSDVPAHCSVCKALVHRYEIWDNDAVVCANCLQDRLNDKHGQSSPIRKQGH